MNLAVVGNKLERLERSLSINSARVSEQYISQAVFRAAGKVTSAVRRFMLQNLAASGVGKFSDPRYYKQTGHLRDMISRVRVVPHRKRGQLKLLIAMPRNAPAFKNQNAKTNFYRAAASINWGSVHGAGGHGGVKGFKAAAKRTIKKGGEASERQLKKLESRKKRIKRAVLKSMKEQRKSIKAKTRAIARLVRSKAGKGYEAERFAAEIAAHQKQYGKLREKMRTAGNFSIIAPKPFFFITPAQASAIQRWFVEVFRREMRAATAPTQERKSNRAA